MAIDSLKHTRSLKPLIMLHATREKIREAFVPPKPKLLDMNPHSGHHHTTRHNCPRLRLEQTLVDLKKQAIILIYFLCHESCLGQKILQTI